MIDLTWQDLLRCYDHVEFFGDSHGTLTIASGEIFNVLHTVDADDKAASDTNFYPTEALDNLSVGDKVAVHVGAPKLSLGVLAKDIDALLLAPKGFIEFPSRFYVIEGRLSDRNTSAKPLVAYGAIISLVDLLAEAAAFLDRVEQKLYFFKDAKVELPVRYDAAVLQSIDKGAIDRLLKHFADPLHREHKLSILSDAVASLAKSQPEASRFEHIVRNVESLAAGTEDAYRLFVSSFSYDKIRTDVENASLDFVSKIHKTFIDIQGQLLGIPIATIVVASQLKATSTCGVEVWTNIAVLAGAWIFVAFLGASIVNQILTLNAISGEVQRQRRRLEKDFAAISSKFVGIFESIGSRIFWYRFVFVIIAIVGVTGALFATWAFRSLTSVGVADCVFK